MSTHFKLGHLHQKLTYKSLSYTQLLRSWNFAVSLWFLVTAFKMNAVLLKCSSVFDSDTEIYKINTMQVVNVSFLFFRILLCVFCSANIILKQRDGFGSRY
jgi:hypothetical protein